MMGIEDLIHMNARLYDPAIGRVLSADPFVKDISNLQDLNRASYVLNNPLSLTDPSGFSWLSKAIKKIGNWIGDNIGTIVTVVVGILTAPIGGIGLFGLTGVFAAIASGAVAGFAGAFVGTLSKGGDLGDALRNGLKGGAMGGLMAGITYGIQQFGSELLKDVNRDGKLFHIDANGHATEAASIYERGSKNIFVNGIMTSKDDAIRYGMERFQGQSFDLFYNPSHGLIPDLLESAVDALGFHSGIAQQFSGVVGGYSTVAAYSQGTLITSSALSVLSKQGITTPGLSLLYSGSAANKYFSEKLFENVGAHLNGFRGNPGDFVHNVIGMNGNPFSMVYSTVVSPTMFIGNNSPHYYAPIPVKY
jgi:RHS repeat-associated protein